MNNNTEWEEQTPTNERIVNACKRAGIPVEMVSETSRFNVGHLIYKCDRGYFDILSEFDDDPGSALFIVATLSKLPGPVEIIKWKDGRIQLTWGGENGDSIVADTLTNACMGAIYSVHNDEEEITNETNH